VDTLNVLLRCITLLHRENMLGNTVASDSKDLVRTILKQIRNKYKQIYGGADNVMDVMNMVQDMLNSPDAYDNLTILQSLSVMLKDKPVIFNNMEKTINISMTSSGLKRSIISLRHGLTNYYKKVEINNLVSKAATQLRLGKLDEDIQEFTTKLITNLEALNNTPKTNSVGVVDELDISEGGNINHLINKIKKQTSAHGRLRTGWKELNDMLGGGFRYGETVLTSALQHNYKSGFLRSLFAQLCMYNKPTLKDNNKKPLCIFLSFEDDADIIIEFFYKYLFFSENTTLENINVEDVDDDSISSFIKDRLCINGFYIKILRVNPADWTYVTLFNKMLEYEACGYELKVVVIDYLSKLPTNNLAIATPIGTPLRDMLTRCRDFFSSRETLFITTHQLSTDAKTLIRNGIPNEELVKEVANKGYYEGSKQLDQVVDLEIHQHIAKIGKHYYLTFQRGKRRYPEIIPNEKKYFMLPFPSNIPCIPPNMDLNGVYVGFGYTKNNANSTGEAVINGIEFDF